MKKLFLIIPIFLLILIGAGCENQTELVKEQQKQIKDLENKIESFENNTTTEETEILLEEVGFIGNTQEEKENKQEQIKIEDNTSEKYSAQKDCTYSCLGKCYSEDICTDESTFQCGSKPVCCPKGTIFCNDTCYTNCSNENIFYCPEDGGKAKCLLDEKDDYNYDTSIQEEKEDIKTEEDSHLSELIKIFDEQLEETKCKNEIIIEQLEKDYKEYQNKLEPIQDEIDLLTIEQQNKGCNEIGFVTGKIAQECNVLSAKISALSFEMISINNEYSVKLGVEPSLDFSFQQSALGSHYQFYYDGDGNGTIYNTNNLLESYNVYCGSGVCNMYSN